MAEPANPQAATAASSTPNSYSERALERLSASIGGMYQDGTIAKAHADRIAKDLAAFGVRLGDPLNLTTLPINEEFIEKAIEVLKNGGLNVKSFQRAMSIWDAAEAKRKRKALVAAGVTKESENYRGTNSTFIELAEEVKLPQEVGDDSTFEPTDEKGPATRQPGEKKA